MNDAPEPSKDRQTLESSAVRGMAGQRSTVQSRVIDQRYGVRRQLMSLAWPAVVEYLLQTALTAVAIVLVGRLGDVEIAAVGIGFQVLMVAWVAYFGLAMGAAALVAQYVGARDARRAEAVAKQSLVAGLIIAIATGAAGFALAGDILAVLGAAPEVIAAGLDFLRILLAFSPLLMVTVVGSGVLRGAGDMKTPMYINTVTTILSIGLACALVFGQFGLPRLEVAGVAWAMVTSQLIGAMLLVMVLFLRPQYIRLSRSGHWLPSREIARRLLAISGPSVLEQVFMRFGMLAYAVLVMSLGTAAYATQQILFTIVNISMMPGFAFATAATTMVGQNVGAGQVRRAQRSGWAATELSALWMSLAGVVFFVFARECLSLLTPDVHLVELGEPCLKIIALAQPPMAAAFALAGALRGAGDARWPMYTTTVTIWLLRLPLGYLFGIALAMGLTGVWLGHAIDFAVRGGLLVWRYARGDWMSIRAPRKSVE
ncbi:MAG: MATE family efflux transporter [Chloroflexota bacterium]